jgi:hypothetical protein
MIRQAQTYLVSAMSGATLIAIAIVAFVLLVSVQVFRDWPIAALGGSDEPHISDSRATSSPSADATGAAPAQTTSAAKAQRSAQGDRSGGGSNAAPTQVSEGSLAPSSGPTATTSPVDTGDQGSNAPSSPAQSPSNSGSNSSPGQGSSSSSGAGSKSGSDSSPATTTTGKLTETVNNTVNQVDETVTGGALEKTGVTEVTEGVVNGVVGPESPVGKVVDGTVETVTGLLGGKP